MSTLSEEKLNKIGKTWLEPYTFKLVAEIGEDTGEADISGILRSDSSTFAPVPGGTESEYTEGNSSIL